MIRKWTSLLLDMPAGALFAGVVVLTVAATDISRGAELENIACVDMQKLFQNYYKTAQYQKELGERRDELQGRAESLKKEMKEIEQEANQLSQKLENPALKQTARSDIKKELNAKQNLLQAKQRDLRSFMSENLQPLKRDYMEKRNEVVKEIRGIIQTYADENDLDFVFDISGMTSNLIPTVLHYPEKSDITEKILERMNKGHEDEVPNTDNVDVPLGDNVTPPAGTKAQ